MDEQKHVKRRTHALVFWKEATCNRAAAAAATNFFFFFNHLQRLGALRFRNTPMLAEAKVTVCMWLHPAQAFRVT